MNYTDNVKAGTGKDIQREQCDPAFLLVGLWHYQDSTTHKAISQFR